MSDSEKTSELLALTSSIVAAHVSNNPVSVGELPALIREVYTTLADVEAGEKQEPAPEPAVPIKRSVTPDYIICLEDGKKMKVLKRHLKAAYDMTPDEYREKWGLPSDYPMVAPNYSKLRSKRAKQIGLGRRG